MTGHAVHAGKVIARKAAWIKFTAVPQPPATQWSVSRTICCSRRRRRRRRCSFMCKQTKHDSNFFSKHLVKCSSKWTAQVAPAKLNNVKDNSQNQKYVEQTQTQRFLMVPVSYGAPSFTFSLTLSRGSPPLPSTQLPPPHPRALFFNLVGKCIRYQGRTWIKKERFVRMKPLE